MSDCFPVITVRRKSTEGPWITPKIRLKIKRRKAVFKKQGRSKVWKKLKKVTTKMINIWRSTSSSSRVQIQLEFFQKCKNV